MARGLKLDNKNSQIQAPPPNRAQALDKDANEAVSKLEEYKKRSWDLGVKFKALIEDRFLPENKSPISKNLEKEVLDGLSALATVINCDDMQPEGMGGTALSQLIMKMLLVQRDTINLLMFRVEKLEKELRNERVSAEKASEKHP
jgi:hypothetical protein